jgi:hypothetical protein
VEEELGEDRLDRESKLLEGLQSRRDQYIHSVRGVSSDTLEIALSGRRYICRGEGHRWRECLHVGRGCYYYGDTSHMKKDCVLVELLREPMVRGLRFRASSNQ